MTLRSSELHDRVRDFIAAGGEADERSDILLLRGSFADAATQTAWLGLSSGTLGADFAVQIYDSEVGGDLSVADPFDPGRQITITIKKPSTEGHSCFFMQDQLGRYLQEVTIQPGLSVADLDPRSAFVTRGLTVNVWEVTAPLEPRATGTRLDPTPYVRDFVPSREVPADLSPWILLTPPAAPSAAFLLWKRIACRRLLASLASSAWLEDDTVWLQSSGPPLYRIRGDDPTIQSAFEPLTQAATWVFFSGLDIEARHIIFANELARGSRLNESFSETVTRALDSAKATYEAHVQSSSRETIRALGELRKTVIDETQKVTQKTQDFAASLWRDLAVTAAPFAMKVLGDAGKETSATIAAGFYFGAAVFVTLSFVLQWRINEAYFASQTHSRGAWLQTLYSYISPRERDEIADTPIIEAMNSYRETRKVLILVYACFVLLLTGFGIHSLLQSQADAPTSSPQITNGGVPSEKPIFPICGPPGQGRCLKDIPPTNGVKR